MALSTAGSPVAPARPPLPEREGPREPENCDPFDAEGPCDPPDADADGDGASNPPF